jgi:hypothetical protein
VLIVSVGDSHRGPLKNRGKTHFLSQITKHERIHNIKHAQDNHSPAAGAHGPGGPNGPPEQSTPAPVERNSASLEGHDTVLTKLRLARGLDATSGETPPRSRAGRPLGRNSASLEGWTPPRRDSASLEALTGSPFPHPLPLPGHLMF